MGRDEKEVLAYEKEGHETERGDERMGEEGRLLSLGHLWMSEFSSESTLITCVCCAGQ